MTLTSVKPGDIVKCDVRGQIFYAEVEEKDKGVLNLRPLGNGWVATYRVTSRQVVAHYRKSKASRS
jgi:hypothetical protein